MGEVELIKATKQVKIYADLFFYGNAASPDLAATAADEVAALWNEPRTAVLIHNDWYAVTFIITGTHAPLLTMEEVQQNLNPRNNYFRIEEYVRGNISYADTVSSNTGVFKKDNLLNASTTAAHEFGHTLGLDHPKNTDIRGKGIPGIMYPRGTLVDPPYQYDPNAAPGRPGGTMNPAARKVQLGDVGALRLHALPYNNMGFAVLGDFTSVWHEADIP